MSVFKVQLTQGTGRMSQGALDKSVVNGASIQRSIWAAGPNKSNRQLFDGATFTDVNYWKRFTFASTNNYDTAFITVLTDDGSVWNDYAPENGFPRTYNVAIAVGTDYSANVINVLSDNGSPAVFCQLMNLTTSPSGGYVNVRINGLSTAVFPLINGTTQVFNPGELGITKIEFSDVLSTDTATTTNVNVLLSFVPQASH